MIQGLTPYPMTVCPVKWTIKPAREIQYLEGQLKILNIIAREMIQGLTPYLMTVCPVKWTIKSAREIQYLEEQLKIVNIIAPDNTSFETLSDEMDNQAEGEIQYLKEIQGLTPNSYQPGGCSWIIHKMWGSQNSMLVQIILCFNEFWTFTNQHHQHSLHTFCFLLIRDFWDVQQLAAVAHLFHLNTSSSSAFHFRFFISTLPILHFTFTFRKAIPPLHFTFSL